jgi:predicted secreted hydrolase
LVNPQRRRWLQRLAALAAAGSSAADAAPVQRGRALVFPRDHGAHVDTRTEWWYVTGWLGRPEAPSHGLQITFFRSRTGLAETLPGQLAPRQLLFAHAALTELGHAPKHRHDQRLARWNGDSAALAAPDTPRAAGAAADDTRVWIGDWSLRRGPDGYRAQCRADGWSAALTLQPTQALLLQGDAGFSRKGPLETQASHYYSQPQLAMRARLQTGNRSGSAIESSGLAWLDHEWSDEILSPDAVGWDWVGFNLFDGAALTAFALRRADGSVLWAGGSFRAGAAHDAGNPRAAHAFGADSVRWTARRHWRSPATAAAYPVEWQLETPAGRFGVRALLDAQELDERQGIGAVYWEGLSELLDEQGRRVGLGYLEMTGYAGRLQL